MRNVPAHIEAKIGVNLHLQKHHPLNIIYQKVANLFPSTFHQLDNICPVVNIEDNFDALRIPADHPSRSLSDTYYWDDRHVLRTHTSAHQVPLLREGLTSFLVCGDVYRKDDIDATHYPVFHQLEGVSLSDSPEQELKATLSRVVETLFPKCEYRFKSDYFPFTDPSWEIEVAYNNDWLEILGCGVIHPEVLRNAGITGKSGWAFGMGLERLAMILFEIPDIRLFWTKDSRFLDQFRNNPNVKFQPYSKQPACYKDIAFWITEQSQFNEKEWLDLVRAIGGDLVENVKCIDKFFDAKNKRESLCYRVTYRDYHRSLTNEEVNQIHNGLREQLPVKMGVLVR